MPYQGQAQFGQGFPGGFGGFGQPGAGFPGGMGFGNQGTVYQGVYMNANITNLENQTMLVLGERRAIQKCFKI